MQNVIYQLDQSPTAKGITDVSVYRDPEGNHVRLGNGRRHRANGRYSSMKTGKSHPWESRLELYDLYNAEVATSVVSYATQPETLSWSIGGRKRRYTPDRIDRLECGSLRVVEVKEDLARLDDDYRAKIAEARFIYEAMGHRFEMRDRSSICISPQFAAVEEIQSCKRMALTADDVHQVSRILANGPRRLREITRDLPRSDGRRVLYAMVVRRLISIDISQGLLDGAQVTQLARP